MARNANWHETGGNARILKGTEEDALAEHAPPQLTDAAAGRGTIAGGQPGHVEALYPPPQAIGRERPQRP